MSGVGLLAWYGLIAVLSLLVAAVALAICRSLAGDDHEIDEIERWLENGQKTGEKHGDI